MVDAGGLRYAWTLPAENFGGECISVHGAFAYEIRKDPRVDLPVAGVHAQPSIQQEPSISNKKRQLVEYFFFPVDLVS